ncbi:MAG: MFS transporter [Fastidiosipilaceae bacterium]
MSTTATNNISSGQSGGRSRMVLLLAISLTFISIGFSGSLIGVAWPAIETEFSLPVTYGGYVSSARTIGVVVASYLLGKMLSRFGIAKVAISAAILMLMSWIGFAIAPSYGWILFSAFPLGFGTGALDSGFNDFVATHYESKHINLLHTCFGIGAIVAPLMMSGMIKQPNGWRKLYLIIAAIELFITIVLFTTYRLWSQVKQQRADQSTLLPDDFRAVNANLHPLKMKGMPWSAASFFLYTSGEVISSMWFSTFLIHTRGMDEAIASRAVAIFFTGLTLARFLNGFASMRVGSRYIIRFGVGCVVVGAIALLLFPSGAIVSLALVFLIGFGFGPIFATLLSMSPQRFGSTGKVNPIGFQMSSSFIGGGVSAPIVGWLFRQIGYNVMPVVLMVIAALLLLTNERVTNILEPYINQSRAVKKEVGGKN